LGIDRHSTPSLSIIIPCFNEEDGIARLAAELAPVLADLEKTRSLELILVDDGSVDATYERARQAFAATPGVQILQHGRNLGLGAAIRTGFAAARGEIIVTTDSDGTYAYRQIASLLSQMTADVDIVTASPYHPDGGVDGVPPYRLILSQGASFLYRLLVSWRLRTYTALFRAYRREVLETTRFYDNGYMSQAEILVRALLNGYRVAEFPTVLRVREYGQSKARVAGIIVAHLRFQAQVLWWRATSLGRRQRRRPADD
jgi:dolichol-phosphate mannosyltransferase